VGFGGHGAEVWHAAVSRKGLGRVGEAMTNVLCVRVCEADHDAGMTGCVVSVLQLGLVDNRVASNCYRRVLVGVEYRSICVPVAIQNNQIKEVERSSHEKNVDHMPEVVLVSGLQDVHQRCVRECVFRPE
jgi:hypothetical protein